MSARKKVNQSRPRALACGVALAVAGAVCFNAASDGRPTSARRSSRPPSNSSARVDSPLSPAPRGNYGVGVWPNAPCIRRPPLLGYPAQAVPQRAFVLKHAKGGNFEKCYVPAGQCDGRASLSDGLRTCNIRQSERSSSANSPKRVATILTGYWRLWRRRERRTC